MYMHANVILICYTDSFPPPSTVYVEHIGPNQIFFSWSAISNQESCPSFFYNISATNCGMCSPSVTTSNSSNCTNFMATAYADHNQCNFTVRSVICGSIAGNISYHLINLAGVLNESLLMKICYHNY